MSLPSSGPISLLSLAQEFGGEVPHSISEYYRGGPYVPNAPENYSIPTSGPISLGNCYGGTNRISIYIVLSSSATNVDLINLVGSTYSAGISDITVLINPGVIIGSSSTSSYAMYVRNFNSGDTVTIANSGYIVGMGGAGGAGGYWTGPNEGAPGGSGGPGLFISRAVNITNNGIIGGGGGGAGGGGSYYGGYNSSSGGGGGAGAGYNYASGGAGGDHDSRGGGSSTSGGSGTLTTGGSGGSAWRNAGANYDYYAGVGGVGGDLGAPGGSGGSASTGRAGGSGGAAGVAINGNSYITWITLGDIRGSRI